VISGDVLQSRKSLTGDQDQERFGVEPAALLRRF